MGLFRKKLKQEHKVMLQHDRAGGNSAYRVNEPVTRDLLLDHFNPVRRSAAPSIAGAGPIHNRGLTIHAVPQHIIAGEAVLIFGQLKGPGHANQPITLYHRINPNPGFTVIGTTRTNANGQYEFTRQLGIVDTNREWFTRGPGVTHSRTVHERVDALVSLAASSTGGLTRHPIVFSGHVTPDHTGGVVALQEQKGSSDDWTTIKTARIGAGSNYTISHAWRVPGGGTAADT